ncbi:SPOR domain-containing protein [Prolixibacter sp. NT017]|uniref:SPOR domain-containing protein n=1 Tax=Prolixibacter sp. NT017 TaxID=2652390 RepID=UPI0012994A4B|nr:SPOR domain-containing protein [Prolixibacter sp. NT017]
MRRHFTLPGLLRATMMLLLFSVSVGAAAQEQDSTQAKPEKYHISQPWSFYINGGATNYFKAINNELDPYFNAYFNEITPFVGAGIQRKINDVFSIETEYEFGFARAIGNDYSYYHDINLNGLINFTNLQAKDVSQKRYAFYGKVGGGVNLFEPSPNIVKPKDKYKISYQVGLLFDYNLTHHLGFRLGASWRGLDSQYYEGGNDKDYKWLRNPNYLVGEVGIVYKFGKRRGEKTAEYMLDLDKKFGLKEVPLAVNSEKKLLPGHEYHLDIKIQKGDLSTPGMLNIPLPKGIYAWDDSTKSYTKTDIHVDYPQLPKGSIMMLSYKILPLKDYNGAQQIDGHFGFYRTGDDNVKISGHLYKDAVYRFAVQVGAFAQYHYTAEELARILHLTEPIKSEEQDGYLKFTLGTFDTYPEAEAFKKRIRRDTKIKDAFVVGYKNGVRLRSISGEFHGVYDDE